MSLVPAYATCTAPNREHGPPLAHPSCNPPAQASSELTVGSPDANGIAANSTGSVKFKPIVGIPSTPADEADVSITFSLTDVRRRSDLGDYTGELRLVPTLRVTDKLNGAAPTENGTMLDVPFPVAVACAATANTAIGAACTLNTTADAVLPGVVREQKRTLWEVHAVRVEDGGPDGVAGTADNTLFATQGVFIP